MPSINLLPWRAWERERLKKLFLTQLASVVVIGAIITFGGGWYFDLAVDNQKDRNRILVDRTKEIDKHIAEIANLREQRALLVDRMRVIQDLQGNRSVIVRVFDQMVVTLAKGVHYHEVLVKDDQVSVTGVAESNNRISALMRNISESEIFHSPTLRSIKEDPENKDYGEQASSFDLGFMQTSGYSKGGE